MGRSEDVTLDRLRMRGHWDTQAETCNKGLNARSGIQERNPNEGTDFLGTKQQMVTEMLERPLNQAEQRTSPRGRSVVTAWRSGKEIQGGTDMHI